MITRDRAARRAEVHALALLREDVDRAAVREELHLALLQRDALDRQAAWDNRRTGWAVPTTPAWTN